jgi:hypothetical protein
MGGDDEQQGDAAVAYAQAHPGYAGMDTLEAEAAGLMGALAWAHEHARYREVLAMGHALNDAWDRRGRRDDLHLMLPWELLISTYIAQPREPAVKTAPEGGATKPAGAG